MDAASTADGISSMLTKHHRGRGNDHVDGNERPYPFVPLPHQMKRVGRVGAEANRNEHHEKSSAEERGCNCGAAHSPTFPISALPMPHRLPLGDFGSMRSDC